MKTITLAITWIVIAVPLGWGVYQSVQKSMPLFQGQSEPDSSRHRFQSASSELRAFAAESFGMLREHPFRFPTIEGSPIIYLGN